MAHFYGAVRGSRGKASRLGGKASGLNVVAASYSGAVSVDLYVNADGADCARVCLIPWRGAGVNRVVFDGPVNGTRFAETCRFVTAA